MASGHHMGKTMGVIRSTWIYNDTHIYTLTIYNYLFMFATFFWSRFFFLFNWYREQK